MDANAIKQWLVVLDQLTYYDLFRLTPRASYDELKYAFHSFCDTFHPDAHSTRPQWERDAIGKIFRRGTEAYRILSDPELRVRYDQALNGGMAQPQEIILGMQVDRPSGSLAVGPQRLIDKLRTPAARPFVLRAEELQKKGDPKQAKIQLVLAMHMDPGNPALETFQKELEEAIQKKDQESKKAWQKG
jgi:DnaJ-class molecular chaperone